MGKPFISIVIPVYNAENYLKRCLDSIKIQDYLKSLYEILIIDGGSTDSTISIAQKYKNVKILKNPYRDAESGKSIGIENAKGEVIALIDSDNELVGKNWLSKMIKPLEDDDEIFGVESPWFLRPADPLINQYVTLLRIADPLARRFHPEMKIEKRKEYDVYHLELGQTPVVGANGFLWRKKFIKLIGRHRPKFEEVNYISLMVEHGHLEYARVRGVGIYHYYCASFSDYVKKRVKIGKKFMTRKGSGQKTWVDQRKGGSFVLAVLYNVSIIFPLLEAIREYKKSKNVAWFYHPIISFITIIIYAYIFILMKIKYFFKI